MHITLRTITLVVGITSSSLIGCTHANVTPATDDASAPNAQDREKPWEVTLTPPALRSGELTELARALKDIGVPAEEMPSGVVIRTAHDLGCYYSVEHDNSYCEYHLSSKGPARGEPRRTMGPAAETLRMLLSSFPVTKGETGAITDYVRCESDRNETVCEIAVLVTDYN